jgi:acyl carrier protein
MNKEDTLNWVISELIYKRLRLAEVGISIDEIKSDSILFEEEGLDLDSIEGLELAVGIEQTLGVKIGSLTEDIAKKRFKTPESITQFILELSETNSKIIELKA